MPPSAVVLLSGGLDSATVVSIYRAADWDVHGLFVDYGQPAVNEERRAASAIADHFAISLRRAVVAGISIPATQALPGRNALFVMTALGVVGTSVDSISLGIHAGSPYWDCTPNFLAAVQTLVDGYTFGVVRVGAPLLGWTKSEIAAYAAETVPRQLTYSCDVAEGPCHKCASCREVDAAAAP